MKVRAAIGLGSNLGDRRAILDVAVHALRAIPETAVLAVSSFHETAPVGGPSGQGSFLNAACLLETGLGPVELLRALQAIENRAGRLRTVRWGERTLDLDILLFGDRSISAAVLVVPHPRLAIRRFVLAPLAEVAPDAIDPFTRQSVADLLANLNRRPSVVGLGDGFAPELLPRLEAELAAIAGVARGDAERWVVAGPDISPGMDRRSSPTFVAILGRASRPPVPVGVPSVLVARAGVEAQVAEILVTCRATRS